MNTGTNIGMNIAINKATKVIVKASKINEKTSGQKRYEYRKNIAY